MKRNKFIVYVGMEIFIQRFLYSHFFFPSGGAGVNIQDFINILNWFTWVSCNDVTIFKMI